MQEMTEILTLIEQIDAKGRVPSRSWSAAWQFTSADLGLVDDGVHLAWPVKSDHLKMDAIEAGLPDVLAVRYALIDSTNTRMVTEGSKNSVASRLYLAEFQYGGRGRRGRKWLSPYGRNLSMSLGMATVKDISNLGGLSLVVGLALADGFEDLGVRDLQLKWPNDILVDGKKLSGILIELVQRQASLEYVVGMGVNVELTDQEIEAIDQPVTDLRRCGVRKSRSELIVKLIGRVQDYLAHFEREGFAPFVSAFNDIHRFHGQTCSVVTGDSSVTGVVSGVGGDGELILLTNEGEQHFHGGEVSLRQKVD